MSEAPPQLPPPANRALLPTFAAVTFLATLTAYWGVLSLALDRDVVDYPDASALLGPAMAGAAGVITWIVLLRMPGARHPWPGAVASAVLSLLGMLAVAAFGYDPVAVLHFAISPFILGAAALSALTVLATWAINPPARR